MRESSKHPRVEPSNTAPPPSSTGTTSGEASVDPVGAVVGAVPPSSTLDDFDIRRTLETIMTVQAAHGQLLVDMLDEFRWIWRVFDDHLSHLILMMSVALWQYVTKRESTLVDYFCS